MQASNAIINVIPKGRPAHISLDFERLRAEGIRHLENLATEVWTDFNAHDPGITLLELLCYAITDLGYRTQMLPIQDIAAGPGSEKPWFEAYEILPISPVTAYDLRKILIDLEGVKNAWLERAQPKDFLIKNLKGGGKYLKKNPAFQIKLPHGEGLKNLAHYFAKRFGAEAGRTFAEGIAQFGVLVEQFNKQPFAEQKKLIAKFREMFQDKITDFILCHYGYFRQEKIDNVADALPLNGIYRILLELDDHLDPASEKVRKRITRRALRRLHQNRGLCQDYLQPEVVQNWCYCLCLDLEVDPAMNEKEVAAEVLYKLQEFILPTVRSYNFKEMRQRGLPCDQIFNGPLLSNGFIPDDQLKASATLPRYIYRSDLQRIASETPGVLDVRDLRIKAPSTGGKYSDEWQIKVVEEDHDPTKKPPGNLKPLLDACCSKITIRRNGLVQMLTGNSLEDQYNTLRMACQPLASSDPGGPEIPIGVFREDLDDYVSVQYELPAIYGVGQNLPRPGHEFSAKQLQAYLLFYDQILAGYLAQLGQVRRLLAVEQNPAEPTMVLQPLFDVPGAKELMGDFADMVFPESAQLALQAALDADIQKLKERIKELEKLKLEKKTEEEKAAIDKMMDGFKSEIAALEQLPGKLEPFLKPAKTFNGLAELRSELTVVMGSKFFATYGLVVENAVWGNFTTQRNNNLVQSLDKIADPSARRQQRRTRLLDHLISRFGESFSEYVATLARPDADPEDNPWRQDFSEYLRDKARFLQTIHTTGAERGRGFNYRLLDQWEQPDVWNTDNVSGIQKRVCRLLGIDSFRSRSLLGTLPYRVEVVSRPNRQGAPVHYVQLERRQESGSKHENPLRPGPILVSKPFKSKDLAEKFRLEVYQNIWREDILKWQPVAGDVVHCEVYFDYEFKNEKGEKVEHGLQSAPKPEEAIETFLHDLEDLVKPQSAQDHEGFHLVEHILLRPDDERDELLQLSLGCDPDETPKDPYSFWLTVVLPKEAGRFEYEDFQQFVEQTFRREAPAHLALRFCWLTREQLLQFEPLFEAWLEAKARCSPDECHVTDAANALIRWLNDTECSCACHPEEEGESPCECG